MSLFRPSVSIGSRNVGPHVDALYALAERCGAVIIVVGPDGVERETQPGAERLVRRAPYAGRSHHDGETDAWRGAAL